MRLSMFLLVILLVGQSFFIFMKGDENLQAISTEDILTILENSHDGDYLLKSKFIENYMAAGGSEDAASRIFVMMTKSENVEKVSLTNVERNLADVITLYGDHQEENLKPITADVQPNGLDKDEVDAEVDYDKNTEDAEMHRKIRAMIEEEFNKHDHLKAFVDDNNDGYPDHEPVYQPAEDHFDADYIVDSANNAEVEAIESYENFEETSNERTNEEGDQKNILRIYQPEDDHYPDHEPIYQPEDPGYESDEPTTNSDAEGYKALPKFFYDSHEDDDEESKYIFDDKNGDGYPDHEPIYQPEDNEMFKSTHASRDTSSDTKKSKHIEL